MHIIVHIGPPKTGTSAIQNAIFRNQEALLEQGLFAFRKKNARALFTYFGRERKALMPAMRRDFADFAEAKRWSADSWEEFEAEVRQLKPETTLISSEHFANLGDPTEFINRLRQTFDRITAVFYVRDAVDLYKSKIDQLIRGGVQFANLETPWDYEFPGPERARNYVELLGRENVIVRNFARSNLKDGDVVADFFHTVSQVMGTPLTLPHTPPPINESLCGAGTVWLLTMNETFERMTTKDDREILKMRQELIQRLRGAESLKGLPRLKVSDPEFIAMIRHNARETTEWFNETCLAGQEKLDVGEPLMAAPDPEVVREQMRDWLFSYLTPEAVAAVSREIVPLSKPQKKMKKWQKRKAEARAKQRGAS